MIEDGLNLVFARYVIRLPGSNSSSKSNLQSSVTSCVNRVFSRLGNSFIGLSLDTCITGYGGCIISAKA
ncbi:hypothetical protein PPTG_23402 [Phytophthora nicotianae INRA-310]|uniref:Uncharacterized protein n=1 Tax=Phytophthora nicotianae (strain INRA-310) TaxID=761204 RepID=W2PZI8_PHYN3|nr:hypothetical protein PPTG_23402 [Phytophthora nicotianae INRA-310]ETN06071.1 hypothetical protein PPTG_23402 [Phytophthora nicotianae INRA-310]